MSWRKGGNPEVSLRLAHLEQDCYASSVGQWPKLLGINQAGLLISTALGYALHHRYTSTGILQWVSTF